MKRFLLDTHTFVWLVGDPTQIDAAFRQDLSDLGNEVFVSAVTHWEIAMNRSRGHLKFRGDVASEVRAAKFTELSITGAHCEAAVALPPIHKDSFDRLLVAQALIEGLILVTRDRVLAAYNVPLVRV